MSIRLASLLHLHVEARGIGLVLAAPLDVILSDTTVLQPDIVYLDRAVPSPWLVDPDARVIEAHVLRDRESAVVAPVSGTQPVDMPPFEGPGFVPSSLWP